MKKLQSRPHYILIFALVTLPTLSLAAFDWGLVLDQSGTVDNAMEILGESVFDSFVYKGTLSPWLSTPFGGAGKFYISAGVDVKYSKYDKNTKKDELEIIPQLLRTDITYDLGGGKEIRAGRMYYADPLGFIAEGLFDGAAFSFDTENTGRFSVGVWYTGFLYKDNAKITMTGADAQSLYNKFEFAKFADTYFASRRLVAAVDWSHPTFTELLRLKAALVGQVDFNDGDEKYHSQYLAVKGSVLKNQFIFDAGVCVEAAEVSKKNESTKLKFGFAGELGIGWMIPATAMSDRLKLTGRFSNGTVGDDGTIAAFVPITTESQGDILEAKLSGISMIRLDYTAKPIDALSFTLASSYFILSDLGTYQGYPSGKDGYFLGNEFSGKVTVSPTSDFRLILDGGVFLPSLGNADKNGDPFWRIKLNAILVLF